MGLTSALKWLYKEMVKTLYCKICIHSLLSWHLMTAQCCIAGRSGLRSAEVSLEIVFLCPSIIFLWTLGPVGT